jgi:anthranilate synthase/aminodeoxychorismate synthase-like glutamine amidotransferase
MILIIDNYDSFVFNLARYFVELDQNVVVHRNDQLSLTEITTLNPTYIVISPGPCTPQEAGLSNAIIEQFGTQIPILGVCLGHQCIGQVFGGTIKRALQPTHGKVRPVIHQRRGIFKGLPDSLFVTRYHSLIVERESLPDSLEVSAVSEEGEIMGLVHRYFPIVGVQFHPEAVLTQGGHQLLKNFLQGYYR